MSAIVDKRVHIAEFRAKRLKQLAVARGATENALIEEGLDLLFREQDRQTARERSLRESKDALTELQAEIRSFPVSRSNRVDMDGAVLVVGTPIDPDRIVHLEQQP
jgi:hypothetical protein